MAALDRRPGHSGQPVSKLGFDITKPIKIGHIRKQGEKGIKSFKSRFFVLYPNFLVYYTDPVDWESDKTYQGFRLRKGAMKLKSGTCNEAMAAGIPSECKAAFILHVPDPTNKRKTYLMDTASEEERKEWMDAIKSAIPSKEAKKEAKK